MVTLLKSTDPILTRLTSFLTMQLSLDRAREPGTVKKDLAALINRLHSITNCSETVRVVCLISEEPVGCVHSCSLASFMLTVFQKVLI